MITLALAFYRSAVRLANEAAAAAARKTTCSHCRRDIPPGKAGRKCRGCRRPIAAVLLLWCLLCFAPAALYSQEPPAEFVVPDLIGSDVVRATGLWDPPRVIDMELPDEARVLFFNTDGSCVQCSAGMVGYHQNLPKWTFLLWDTEYGRAQRGGSGPDRVSRYAKARGMRLFNVTGRDTYDYMEWCVKTHRFAAIGFFGSHFQTMYGRDFRREKYLVCNNWGGEKVSEYSLAEFKRQHQASGLWMFCPDEPACPPSPRIVEWWNWPDRK